MPRDVTGLVTLKSTYCRVGLGHPPSVLEAGWRGVLVLELVNHSSNPVRVYSNTGISQILFFRGEEAAVSYADKKGKYQNQGEGQREPRRHLRGRRERWAQLRGCCLAACSCLFASIATCKVACPSIRPIAGGAFLPHDS